FANNIYHPDVTDAMFRQVQSAGTKPFKPVSAGTGTSFINAVDYDLGRQRSAYYDKDSARYQYTPGVNTTGNRGHTYRNDGVDIQPVADKKNAYYVFSIEDGEWLQYSIDIKQAGDYNVSFRIAADSANGSLSLSDGENILVKEQPVPPTGGLQNWQDTRPAVIRLDKGMHHFRIHAVRGGFNFISWQLTKS
ncbi:MAG: carbohydrate-binding protein, partial [Bacteroidetes bacterium]|nr:carbohydrate-binding protein [Bacteroidota bacterium]